MSFFGDYSTIYAVREQYIGSSSDKRDDVIAQLITRTSRQIDAICQRVFVPRIVTQLYDANQSASLVLDDDLLEVLTLTNGDGLTISASDFALYPLNASAKYKIVLKGSSGKSFVGSSEGDSEGAITVAGIWGYHDRYDTAWVDSGATLTASINASVTSIAGVSTQSIRAGQLVRIDTEYLYVRSVAIDATNGDTLTVSRAANGSTAAAHNSGEILEVWTNPIVEDLTTTAVVAYNRLKDNPAGESQNVGGNVFVTPRDVAQWIAKRCASLALIRGSFF